MRSPDSANKANKANKVRPDPERDCSLNSLCSQNPRTSFAPPAQWRGAPEPPFSVRKPDLPGAITPPRPPHSDNLT
jgi:hypothetical protein